VHRACVPVRSLPGERSHRNLSSEAARGAGGNFLQRSSYPPSPRMKSHAEPKVYKESAERDFEILPDACAAAPKRSANRGCRARRAAVLAVGDSVRLFKPLRADVLQIRHRSVIGRSRARPLRD
jgi:hypothetical protein